VLQKPIPKGIVWIASSKRDLKNFPEPVQKAVGFALWGAQVGEKHENSKVLKGFGDAGVIEVIEDYEGDTYRAVYTVRFSEAVYVLHCFQKKSHRGSETPRGDLALVRKRLRDAELLHEEAKKGKH
jgi:phage-related protein